jgi:hypothetical protein
MYRSSGFITDVLIAHLKPEAVINIVKTVCDHVERKSITASKTPKSMHCSYDANFKLLVIKNTQKKPAAGL